MKPLILPYKGVVPKVAPTAFVAPSANIIGDVEIGAQCGVWFNCTIRGDVAEIRIGERTNIQDGTSIHVTRGGHPTIIGAGVTVGHAALLHACRIEDNAFIGMGAIVMDDVVVESGAMVAAGAMVTPHKRVPKGQLWAGRPAKYFRDLTPEEIAFIPVSAANYVKHVEEYLAEKNFIGVDMNYNIYALGPSIYSREFYQDVEANRVGSGFSFLALLALIITIIMMATFIIALLAFHRQSRRCGEPDAAGHYPERRTFD